MLVNFVVYNFFKSIFNSFLKVYFLIILLDCLISFFENGIIDLYHSHIFVHKYNKLILKFLNL